MSAVTDTELDLSLVDAIVARIGRGAGCAVPILQALQREFRYLPEAALRRVCVTTDIAPADIESVATFFPQFRRTPAGKHAINVCDGTACHLKGSFDVREALARRLGLADGEDTDSEGLFTLEMVRCLGCCTLAPAVQIDGVTYGHVRPEAVGAMLEDFLAHVDDAPAPVRAAANDVVSGAEIRIGLGSCCVAGGSEKIRRVLEDTVARYGLDARVKHVSCVGMCHRTPLLEIARPGLPPKLFTNVQPDDVPAIVLGEFAARGPLARLRSAALRRLDDWYTGAGPESPERRSLDLEAGPAAVFLASQRRIATEHCGALAPLDLDEYIRLGGFSALARCLSGLESGWTPPAALGIALASGPALRPEAIIAEIAASGLRGRGGAGFMTARKWGIVRDAPGALKYVVCNGDEGDPGAFMDRMILESYPFRVIEGMLIAALATGASRGVFYIRAEYPLAVTRMRAAIAACEHAGILSETVLDAPFSFHAEVREGAGAFVCGEETALIASLEGRRPAPSFRPPYPAIRGLDGVPTLVNNVETLALVSWILRNGAAQFAALGTEHSRGTKVFALAGKVRRGGLIEVPMGTTVRRIVEELGGGAEEGRVFKGVQIGGPSGGCIPASLADLPVDYEALLEAGSMMGSGGFVVLDDTDCIVEMTRYFLSFTQLESCGKCTPCRVGTRQMLGILEMLCDGRAKPADLEELERIARQVKALSLCGLGKTAPNPVLTGLRHFREEFEAHAAGRCPAGKCRPLTTFVIGDACIGCTKCAQQCPVGAIAPNPYAKHTIDAERCIRCGACRDSCPVHAVETM